MSIELHPSALSVVELAYFFTLRLGLNICLPRREDLVMPAAVTRWHSMLRDWQGQHRRETAGGGSAAAWGAQYGIGRNYSWGPS